MQQSDKTMRIAMTLSSIEILICMRIEVEREDMEPGVEYGTDSCISFGQKFNW